MTTENWLAFTAIIIPLIVGSGISIYHVIMRDVKAHIKEAFSILREEKIKELSEELQRKENKISRLQDQVKDMN